MKKSVRDFLFDKGFQDKISLQSIKEHDDLKKDKPETALAMLIGYVLKFKGENIPLSKTEASDISEIKEKSLEQFRLHQTETVSKIRYLRIAVAASVLVLFTAGAYWLGRNHIFEGLNQQSGIIEFNTPKGQQSELILPDGTFVALNYDSKLKYHISANKKMQEVELNGEAFFRVTKNKYRTFRVITRDMNVNVLGTEFNVRAYKNDLRTETTLLEGRIEIKGIQNQNKPVFLEPGQKWSYNKAENKQELVKVNAKLSTLWRNGEYYFEKIPLGELAKTLERMYKVNIHFQNTGLENEVYTGSVYQNEKIDTLFRIINLTVPIKVKTEKNEIWISKK